MTELSKKEQEKALEISHEFLDTIHELTKQKLNDVSEDVLKQGMYNFVVRNLAAIVYASKEPTLFFNNLINDVKKMAKLINLHKKKEKNEKLH